MSKKLVVGLPAQAAYDYPILIDAGILQEPQHWLPTRRYEHYIVITDHTVKKHYGHSLIAALHKLGCNAKLLSFPSGEASKTQTTKTQLEESMLRTHCGRNTLCLALGGGVVGDLAGFLSATYMRGIDYIQIPTTLLAMVDSSVGGKTAIDTAHGKNLIGAFWQPKAVLADLDCLATLPKKHIINGLVEALKMFLTSDKASLQYLQRNLDAALAGDHKVLTQIIYRAVKIKADVVERDEKESNLRMILNFGHTIGHALEQISRYKILHGVAVAYGILVEAKIAQLLGLLSVKHYADIQTILARLGIHSKALRKFDIDQIIQATALDKKTTTQQARYVLLNSLGSVLQTQGKFAHPVENAVVLAAFAELGD